MNKQTIAALQAERRAVQSGKVAPGRVWVVKKRPDGTVDRRQVSVSGYQAKRQAEAAKQNTALPARRMMGVSQGRFAELLGISPATVRNLEQGRTKPTGPTSKLLSIAEQFPQIFISSTSAKGSASQVPALLGKTASLEGTAKISVHKAQAENRRDESARSKLEKQKPGARTRVAAVTLPRQ